MSAEKCTCLFCRMARYNRAVQSGMEPAEDNPMREIEHNQQHRREAIEREREQIVQLIRDSDEGVFFYARGDGALSQDFDNERDAMEARRNDELKWRGGKV